MSVVGAAAPPSMSRRAITAGLNRDCLCITLDRAALFEALAREAGDAQIAEQLCRSHPHLVADAPVFVARDDLDAMLGVVSAVEHAARLPAFRDAVLARAPAIALVDHGPAGVFMGYDFHVGDAGPRLIEINTNAGGAFINALVRRRQISCCAAASDAMKAAGTDDFDDAVFKMFDNEWRRQRSGGGRLNRIAVVDDAPGEQYLHPEFLLARRLFLRRGVDALIVDPSALAYEGGALKAGGLAIDLVYNRLVDFALGDPAHAALRRAYEDGAVVLTPNPRNHALFSDKRNLVLLSDSEAMMAAGLSQADAAALKAVPRALEVTPDTACRLWAERKGWFFKPAAGYGSRAVYRGDKITKRAWEEVVSGGYIAQEFAAPGRRSIKIDGMPAQRKLDIRLYTYEGALLIAAARVYQGQTTNFRTPGGGFAPVFVL